MADKKTIKLSQAAKKLNVGISTIATACGEEAETIEEVYEPFLIQEGFIQRTARGREATPKAYAHLGIPFNE